MVKRLILILFFSAAIFGGLFGWKFLQIGKAMNELTLPPPAVVAATEVKTVMWQPYLSSVGSLVAVAGIDVSNEIAGKVAAIHFDSGQTVRKGQLLVEMDISTDLAELKALLAEERLAKVRFDRSEKLIARQFVSQSDYDQNRALLEQAKALASAKRTVIEKKRIHAPFDGKLGIRQIDVGQYLEEGAAMVPLQQLDPIYIDFMLPEGHLARLAVGQKIEVTVQAFPGQRFSGEISALNPGIDVGTRSIKVRATLSNRERKLRPGMFADIRVLLSERRTVLAVPDTSITYNPYGDSVFAIEAGQEGLVARLKQVVTGETRNGLVEITEGLVAGEKVVSAGQVKLRNGMQVALDDKPAPGERGNRE
ncbi:MAG: efflux RND transporter periplasmic adaptor subunit [Gammaproteobacteria bacterium]